MLQGLVNDIFGFKSRAVGITVYFLALYSLVFLEQKCGQQITGALKSESGRYLNEEKREEEEH